MMGLAKIAPDGCRIMLLSPAGATAEPSRRRPAVTWRRCSCIGHHEPEILSFTATY